MASWFCPGGLQPFLGGADGQDTRGQILHGAVVQPGGKTAALLVGGVDGARQQEFALALGVLQLADHPPEHRGEQEKKEQQAAAEHRHRGPPGAVGPLLDGRVVVVQLQQHHPPRRGPQPAAHLKEGAGRALETVLLPDHPRDAAGRGGAAQGGGLLLPERGGPPDEAGFVGVADHAVVGEQLDPDDAVGAQNLGDLPVKGLDGLRLPAHQAVGDFGLDDHFGQHDRHPDALVDGLTAFHPLVHHRRDGTHRHGDHESRREHHEQQPPR